MYEQVQNEFDTRLRTTRPFKRKAEIALGRFLVVSGQKAYVAEIDDAGCRITDPSAGPPFADHTAVGDEASGANERRIADAKTDATFLRADVEVVGTYELYNINHRKLENLIHRIIDSASFDIEIKDRFGNPVVPREWFIVAFAVVDEAVQRIIDGSIKSYMYDPQQVRLVEGKAG